MIGSVILMMLGGFVAREADGFLAALGSLAFVGGAIGAGWWVIAVIGAIFSGNRR